MLIGYVSNENYSAIADVIVEFDQDGQRKAQVRSSPRGAIDADIPPGTYRITLAKEGFGSKSTIEQVDPARPLQVRLVSDSLYGYVWPKWIEGGQKGEFRVHSPKPYHLSLWRYGLKKELAQPIGWFDEHGPRPNLQTLPNGDFTQTGVGWNRYGYSKKYKADGTCAEHGTDTIHCTHRCFYQNQLIAAPQRSGLYYFHAETESGDFVSFPWVVAPAKPQAAIAVIASTNTWNAYNNFGGRSNYINSTQLPPQPTVDARRDLSRFTSDASVWEAPDAEYRPLSFERPEPFNHIPKQTEVTDPIQGRQPCHLAPAEWRLLGWLEREGFDYDFYSDYQLDCGRLNLDAYQILIISTHPEYWSREAYDKVKDWVFNRGGKLMYLGGNGIDCEVEFVNESTMRCKTWHPRSSASPILTDPQTGKTFDCRFHFKGESPAALLGVVFTEAGAATSAPYRVVDSSHWVFSSTGLKNGDIFGAHSLHERCPGGASGHETDKRTSSSPANTMLLARGLNVDGGGAEMIFFETSGQGAVFSVGSITWPASVLVDAAVSKITRNVLERFLGSGQKNVAPSPFPQKSA
ncbi:MAG TPA: N,N-dimethylformamidase beta subunit family domain-containing protein [Candidatus Saccharimonadales bacterium]|nr:N,N-dimethylformamidase beta subunit family domain-containing protein [Candidatus Saccharimonadales bacterium]